MKKTLDNLESKAKPAPDNPRGTVIAIGGHEDKENGREVLRRVAESVKGGTLVICTAASSEPQGAWRDYQKAFKDLPVKTEHLRIDKRADSESPDAMKLLEKSRGVFFSGGDQAMITSKLGGTLLCDCIREIYESGGVVAGTSSGASIMSDVMMIEGDSDKSHRLGSALTLAPGLALLNGMVIDQHFAERGRIGRLLGAISLNPRLLGIGIDEDTAFVMQRGHLEVVGCGAIYIVDGRGLTHSRVRETKPNDALSSFDFRLHVLSAGDRFKLDTRTPIGRKDEPAETD